MSVAEVVLPCGPSDEKIEVGDILIKINRKLLTQFAQLDETLDDGVGKKVSLLLHRGIGSIQSTLEDAKVYIHCLLIKLSILKYT